MEDIDAAFHRSINRTSENPEKKLIAGDKEPGPTSNDTPKITLSGLLNALDGIGAQEGRLLFATTNRYEALDVALRRPGRMDVHVEFKLASQYQAGELFERFYTPDDAPSTGVENGNTDRVSPSLKEKLVDAELPEYEKLFALGQRKLNLTELALASEKFKEYIPDGELSMATLQGYLMIHKGRPYDALDGVEAWVREERAKKVVKDTVM